ncbi:MAG: hypothetical protein ACYTGZ_17180 [Planctomycetota bacterium]|jgi:hypothetical protein
MDASLVLFGIQAGVKLGRKVYDVLVDETIERPLLLPVGTLYADIGAADAQEYFDTHQELVEPGGLYADLSEEELVLAYKTIRNIDEEISGPLYKTVADSTRAMTEAITLVNEAALYEQYFEGLGARPALQRIVGTIVEIGIDYFVSHPDAMGRDSNARKIVFAFVSGLDDADFAEGTERDIVGDLLTAALKTLDTSFTLIDDNERASALLGGMTKALLADIDAAGDINEFLDRKDLIKRVGSSLFRGAAGAFTENINLFMRDGETVTVLAESTLTRVLEGIKDQEDIFTNESIELLYKSALNAVADNAELLADDEFIAELISQTTRAVAEAEEIFAVETAGAIAQAALEVVRDNAEMLIDPSNPQKQLLADAVGAIAGSLAESVGGARDLLSRSQLVDLARVVFLEVAEHPEHLIDADPDDPKDMALAQIVGSVAAALGENPEFFVTGDGFIRLVQDTIHVAVLNADKLIDFGDPDTSRNLLFKILQQVVLVITDEANDPRRLVTREVFLEIVETVLPLVSANLEVVIGDQPDAIEATVRKALELASGVLENRTNGANLPELIEELLRRVLWGELNLNDEAAVLAAARTALRQAA